MIHSFIHSFGTLEDINFYFFNPGDMSGGAYARLNILLLFGFQHNMLQVVEEMASLFTSAKRNTWSDACIENAQFRPVF